MLFTFFSLLIAASQAQSINNTAASVTQIAVYPPFPIRNGTNMQHTQRAYDVSLITAISSTTVVYAISCSPWTTMTRFNDVCGTSYVPDVITVTESPDEWHWSAQGKSLVCSNLREKTKTCTSITNRLESYIAPGTQDGLLAGFLEYFTTMSPVAVNVTAGFENVPATVLESLEDDATGIATIQTGSPGPASTSQLSVRPTSFTAPVLEGPSAGSGTTRSAPTESASTGSAPRVLFLRSDSPVPILLTLNSSFGTYIAPPLFVNRSLRSASSRCWVSAPSSSLTAADKSSTLRSNPGLLPLLYIRDARRVSSHIQTMIIDQMKLKIDTMNRNM
ncbi:hypothetical protein SVAN01_01179 [Stagonosporopsis vannaccii]|nr:hypothetical protein SVAN01_01179 [Stagonosporopsis vannaccii]